MTRASLKQGVLQSGLFKPQFRCGVVEVAGSVVEVAGREDFDDDPSADAHQWFQNSNCDDIALRQNLPMRQNYAAMTFSDK
eukprot:scaffold10064_cov13-Tisochrysis_lutea.AAC.1